MFQPAAFREDDLMPNWRWCAPTRWGYWSATASRD